MPRTRAQRRAVEAARPRLVRLADVLPPALLAEYVENAPRGVTLEAWLVQRNVRARVAGDTSAALRLPLRALAHSSEPILRTTSDDDDDKATDDVAADATRETMDMSVFYEVLVEQEFVGLQGGWLAMRQAQERAAFAGDPLRAQLRRMPSLLAYPAKTTSTIATNAGIDEVD